MLKFYLILMKKFSNLKLLCIEKLRSVTSNVIINFYQIYFFRKKTKKANLYTLQYTSRSILRDDTFHLFKNTSQILKKNNNFLQTQSCSFSTQETIDKLPVEKEKELKANYKEIKNVIFPLFKTKAVKRLLAYSLILTIGSKLLITTVSKNL